MGAASLTACAPTLPARRRRELAFVAVALASAMALSGCERASAPVAFHADGYPEKLSDWSVVLRHGSRLQPNDRVVPYDLNTPLFSDYAQKLRTVWMPQGTAAQYSAVDTFEFPVGTVFSKTFYYSTTADGAVLTTAHTPAGDKPGSIDLAQHRLIETRLLVRRASGWVALPYIWNDEQ